jgi:aldehyde dehydrogenase (NAD+)
VAAIAAGNCCILKPSEIASATSSVLKKMIDEAFTPAFVTCVEGGIEASNKLLNQKFDYIFFTGNSVVGKIVAASAVRNLTPYTLELGGKSPCIVDEKINLETAAKRIAWGKWLNAGQTCVAPDYLFVHKRVKAQLVKAIQKYTQQFFGADALSSVEFPRIINEKHFHRLVSMLNDGKIIFGGKGDATTLCIEPTLIENPSWDDSIMQQEIFGPLLPVIEFENIDEVITKVNEQPKPLSLYIFSSSKKFQHKIIHECSSGGCMINDVAEHLSNPHLPFGGVGESGTGSYHGKFGFDTFSHHKAVMKKSTLFALPLRYPPYARRPLWFVKWFLR